ncbi:MAG: homoserine kinase [Microcystaceae cyanobacterium]
MLSFTVTVPATTANLGPGFDCLGAALSLYNHVTFTVPDEPTTDLLITVTGKERDRVPTDKSNLIYQAFLKLYQAFGQSPPSLHLEIDLGIPLARGLGSSATAIVGGLVGANTLLQKTMTPYQLKPFNRGEVLDLAIEMEGHPDNVAPALLGDCQLSIQTEANLRIIPIAWQSQLVPIVAIPNFELSTEMARSVLPKDYSRADAIFNASHLGLLLRGLEKGRGDWLTIAMEDQIHQPYRQSLIPGYGAVKAAARSAGAYNLVISGAGPTLLAIASPEQAASVASAMEQAWQTEGIVAEAQVLKLDGQGARVTETKKS